MVDSLFRARVNHVLVTPPQRKKLIHNPPDSVPPDERVFFITVCCDRRGQNQLCHRELAKRLFESVAFRHERGDWWMHFVLLMPDHLHALASFPKGTDMTTIISQWKKYTARQLAIIWQRDFFDHRLRKEENFREKEDYIRMNPVRAGLVSKPEDWPYV
jgi:REP element-mobilizing transposase RayT